jgi:hypothetical protein
MRFQRLVPILALALWPQAAHSFCGFYVAGGGSKLFNHASQVVLARSGDRTVLTMASDYQGDPSQFALVVPVPTVLQKGQIHVAEPGLVEKLDAYSAPRLVEYFDPDPCAVADRAMKVMELRAPATAGLARSQIAAGLGVRVEARYTVGEYDILILSALESRGLETWLIRQGYRIPPGASRVLNGYIKQGLKFFVAKVNLGEQKRLGVTTLRPLQMAYESPRFMLPIRLGMANADGPQELFVYALTQNGRVETVNYRTVKLPADAEIPEYVKDHWADFYRAMFAEQTRKEGMGVVFCEYAWDAAWCDPCPTNPPAPAEMRQLGAFWLDPSRSRNGLGGDRVFLTRLHVRYDAAHFPEDLSLQETGDRTNYQARFVVRHPWTGTSDCPGANAYRAALRTRRLERSPAGPWRRSAATGRWTPTGRPPATGRSGGSGCGRSERTTQSGGRTLPRVAEPLRSHLPVSAFDLPKKPLKMSFAWRARLSATSRSRCPAAARSLSEAALWRAMMASRSCCSTLERCSWSACDTLPATRSRIAPESSPTRGCCAEPPSLRSTIRLPWASVSAPAPSMPPISGVWTSSLGTVPLSV